MACHKKRNREWGFMGFHKICICHHYLYSSSTVPAYVVYSTDVWEVRFLFKIHALALFKQQASEQAPVVSIIYLSCFPGRVPQVCQFQCTGTMTLLTHGINAVHASYHFFFTKVNFLKIIGLYQKLLNQY